jgi:hypothetical protein
MIGRGYSGNTLFTSICDAHFVLILSPAGFHWADTAKETTKAKDKKPIFLMNIKI